LFTEELLDKSSTMRKKWEDAVKRTVAKMLIKRKSGLPYPTWNKAPVWTGRH
jgi:hypothetical protein